MSMPAAAGQLKFHVLQGEMSCWFSFGDAAATQSRCLECLELGAHRDEISACSRRSFDLYAVGLLVMP